MSGKKILIVTSVFPYPLNSGGAQAQFHMIDRLRKEMDVSLAYISNSSGSEQELKALWPDVSFYGYQGRIPNFFLRKYKKIISRLYAKLDIHKETLINPVLSYSFEKKLNYGFIDFLQNIVESNKIGIIQFEFTERLNLAFGFPDIKRIFIQHEIHFIRNRRFIKDPKLLPAHDYYKFNMLKQQEITCMNACDAVVTLTETDKRILEKEGVKAPVYVSPAIIPAPAAVLPADYQYAGNIIFIGGEQHHPNYEGVMWFLSQVWNRILQERPDSRLILIGKWGRKTQAQICRDYKNIQMPGFVPSLAPYQTTSIMIIPILTGSGMRMKIIEAANRGIPFVTTTVGVEGMDFINNSDCYIADAPGDFAKKTIELMDSRQAQLRFRENAFRIITERYSPDALFKQRLHVYEEIARSISE